MTLFRVRNKTIMKGKGSSKKQHKNKIALQFSESCLIAEPQA